MVAALAVTLEVVPPISTLALGIALKVEPPSGRQVRAAEGAHHDEVCAVAEVRERGGAWFA